MIARADAVVIGAGVIGASVAHFLARLGYGDVVLLEQRRICGGSSQYSSANIRQHYSNEVAIRLAVRGRHLIANGEEELGGPTGFQQDGFLVLAPAAQADALRAVVPLQQRLGVSTTLLTPAEVAGRWPVLDLTGVELACFEDTAGWAEPVTTVETIARAAERDHGLRIYEGCRALGITESGGRVTGVITGDGEIATEVVVNACGPWGDRTGSMVGVDYPIELSREHEGIFDLPDDVRFPVVADSAQQLYFRRYGDDKLLVGEGYPKATEPADPDDPDDGSDEAHLLRMTPRLVRRVPRLADTIGQPGFGGSFVTGYSGVYDITEDWYPIVGEERVTGYFSAFGGSGHCFKLGPAIGESLAHVIAGLEPPVDISSLSGERFATGRTFRSVWGPGNRG